MGDGALVGVMAGLKKDTGNGFSASLHEDVDYDPNARSSTDPMPNMHANSGTEASSISSPAPASGTVAHQENQEEGSRFQRAPNLIPNVKYPSREEIEETSRLVADLTAEEYRL